VAEQYFHRSEMQTVHTMLRREFGHLPGLIREAANIERARIIAEHFSSIAGALHHHHRAEDDHVWPLLNRRAGHSVALQVRAMETQHFELAIRLARLGKGIAKWVAGDVAPNGPGPGIAAGRFAGLLDEHLAAEEEIVVPFMEQHISANEWDEIVQHGAAAADPAGLALAFGMLMYEGDSDVVERALAHLPTDERSAFRSRAAESFSQHAQQVYGTMTPPLSTEL
jgi:hemerythrin-like domain-containing protein